MSHETDGETWALPPDDLSLARDEVHIWRLALDLPPGEVERLFSSSNT